MRGEKYYRKREKRRCINEKIESRRRNSERRKILCEKRKKEVYKLEDGE